MKGILYLMLLLAAAIGPMRAEAPVADDATVTAWIDGLTALDAFDTGILPARGGLNFPPLEATREWSVAGLSQGVPHQRNDALRNLVAAGPQALRLLLDHLDDKRATRFTLEHRPAFGAMWHEAQLPAPRPNKKEVAGLELDGLNDDWRDERKSIHTYTVTVGDVCFVIIGMIVNRSYDAVHYQHTNCIVINSPTTSPVIAKALRTMWGGRSTADDLKLWLDEDFEVGDAGAATRLLYYFPGTANTRVLEHLDHLIESDDKGLKRFVHAIAWCKDAAISARIRATAVLTKDPDLLAAAMPAFAEPGNPQRLAELRKLLARWKSRDARALESILLTGIASQPDHAAEFLEAVLSDGDHAAHSACIGACGELMAPPVAPLRRLLDDRSDGRGYYLIEGEGVEAKAGAPDLLRHRICDNAYVLISRALGDKRAACIGDRAAMNLRIAGLKRRLKKQESAWPFTTAELAERETQLTGRGRDFRQQGEPLKTGEPQR